MESLVLVLMHKHRLVQESSVSVKFACWWMGSPNMIFFPNENFFFPRPIRFLKRMKDVELLIDTETNNRLWVPEQPIFLVQKFAST
jgi:hypothetical protein